MSTATTIGLHQLDYPIYMSPIESVVNDVFPVTYEVRTLVFTSQWIDVVACCHGDEVTDVRERQILASEGLRLMSSRLRRRLLAR